MSARLLAKSCAIALIAGLAAWLPMAILLTVDMDANLALPAAVRMLPLALLGAFAVGLPIALLTYVLSGSHLRGSAYPVFLAANLAGMVLLTVTFLLGHLFGVFLFGLPTLVAANVFALLGWFWILKPVPEAQHG